MTSSTCRSPVTLLLQGQLNLILSLTLLLSAPFTWLYLVPLTSHRLSYHRPFACAGSSCSSPLSLPGFLGTLTHLSRVGSTMAPARLSRLSLEKLPCYSTDFLPCHRHSSHSSCRLFVHHDPMSSARVETPPGFSQSCTGPSVNSC